MITRPFWQWLLLLGAQLSVVVWTASVLRDDWPATLALTVAATGAGTSWQRWGTAARRAQARLVGTALRTHRDPGVRDRETVDLEARARLATPTWTLWIPLALFGALAVAAVIAAVLRSDAAAATPVLPALLVGGLTTLAMRADVQAAALWLVDPPHEALADEP